MKFSYISYVNNIDNSKNSMHVSLDVFIGLFQKYHKRGAGIGLYGNDLPLVHMQLQKY